ncbi:DUF2993 domain-containing protein [Microbacterium sp.]|uniref:LmeA family phospholipid-binding protein n=1 Tax=Microbacterium sp. TaxID=51671 RepID=UPI003C78FC20
MSDENPTQPLPDPRAQWVLSTDAEASASAPLAPRAPKPRRRWPWIVAVLIVVVLIAGAWFAGEVIARGIVERTIREQLISNLDVPADQQFDIDIPGPILPQLIVGSLGSVTISSDDVPLSDGVSGGSDGGLTADVTVHAQDVPIRGGDWSGGIATVRLDEAQLRTLLGQVEGFPADTVSIDAPDVAADFELRLFGLTVPVGVSLIPSAAGGDIVLTPSALRVAGTEVSSDALRQQFGAITSTVLRDWNVCIADRLPRAVELTSIDVRREWVEAQFEIDSTILTDPAAQAKGSCA